MTKFLKFTTVIIFCFVVINKGFSDETEEKVKYTIKTRTPQVEAAINNRRDRHTQLTKFMAQGIIGENNRGYIEVLVLNQEAQVFVDEENRDRRTIYKALVQQYNLEGDLEVIEKVYAKARHKRANLGDKIQKEDGIWITKQLSGSSE